MPGWGVLGELLQHARLLEDQGGNDVYAVLLLVFLVRGEACPLGIQHSRRRLFSIIMLTL
jgi:hypothetical protein